MIRHLLIAAAVAISAICAHAQTAPGSLESIVAEVAAQCPQAIDQGSTLQTVRLTDSALEIHLAMALPAAQFPMIQQNMGMMRPTLLKILSASPDMSKILSLAASGGRGLSVVMLCKDDPKLNFSIDYTAQELTDSLK